jgi:HSP20 family protein
MSLIRWNPARELLNIEREFNRLFKSLSGRLGFSDSESKENGYENAVWIPLTDIAENDNNYIIKMDLPGVNKDDIIISYSDGKLNISGERKQEKEEKNSTYHRIERVYGRYYRSFNLPKVEEDKIEAVVKDGQLTITAPKTEEAKPKEIAIKTK